MELTTRRYLDRTRCCNAPVAIEIDDDTPTEIDPAYPVLSHADRRLAKRGRIEDPRPAWLAEHGPVIWKGEDHRDGHEVAHALVLCPKCSAINRLITSDGVRGQVNESPCSHSCERAASVNCSCSCGGANHGRLHTI